MRYGRDVKGWGGYEILDRAGLDRGGERGRKTEGTERKKERERDRQWGRGGEGLSLVCW